MTRGEIVVLGYYALVAVAAVVMAVLVSNMDAKPKLNCQIAEISPDYTHLEREQCRMLRHRKL